MLDEAFMGLASVVIDEQYLIIHNINESEAGILLVELNVSRTLRLTVTALYLNSGQSSCKVISVR